jgi:hypothetical protein
LDVLQLVQSLRKRTYGVYLECMEVSLKITKVNSEHTSIKVRCTQVSTSLRYNGDLLGSAVQTHISAHTTRYVDVALGFKLTINVDIETTA